MNREEMIKQAFFGPTGECQMTVQDNLHCTFNMPKALKSVLEGKEEKPQGLPPYAPRRPFVVDEYPECPANWMNGSDITSSYFVPIKAEHGMWLDFNGCWNHKHHVAIVVSVQGVNAVTGLPTKELNLEQYLEKCPKHDVPFQQDRYCPECKFKWPKQNYLCTTGTHQGLLWLDGFRTPDGKVRQYVFTEQEARGVAKAVIGEDRVFAVGIGFYLSKEPKPEPTVRAFRGMVTKCATASLDMHCDESESLNMMDAPGLETLGAPAAAPEKELTGHKLKRRSRRSGSRKIQSKSYEVAAGASINQDVFPDPKDIDFWEETPAGMIYVNYCDENTAFQIIESGKRDESTDGFLQNIPVGN